MVSFYWVAELAGTRKFAEQSVVCLFGRQSPLKLLISEINPKTSLTLKSSYDSSHIVIADELAVLL